MVREIDAGKCIVALGHLFFRPGSRNDLAVKHDIQWEQEGKHVVVTTQVVNEGSDMMVYAVGKTIKKEFNLMEAYD